MFSGKTEILLTQVKRSSIFLLFSFVLLMVTTFSVCNCHFSFQSRGEILIVVFAFIPQLCFPEFGGGGRVPQASHLFSAVTRAFHVINKGKMKNKDV